MAVTKLASSRGIKTKKISSINIKGGLCGNGFGGERVFTVPVFRGDGKLPDEKDIKKTEIFI